MDRSRRPLPWFVAALLGGFGVVIAMLLLARTAPAARAQGSGLQLQKTLLKNSNVVRVGETLTFAITITNNWNTTVITLPMTDNYDQSIMRFLDANPPQSAHNAATGTINWNNVLSAPLAPGQQIVILVRFIAEHPSPQVVNRAATHDAYDTNGNAVGNGQDQEDNESVGAHTPLTKTLDLNGAPVAGQRITFTLTVGNDGLVNVNILPIRDTFDPNALRFIEADPPIDAEAPGVLVWSNALRPPLPSVLAPNQTVKITVVFTALANIDQTINHAEVIGAEDSFGNSLAPAADDVPIRILPGPATPTATRTPRPTPRPQPNVPTETVEATAEATPTTGAIEATPTGGPAGVAETPVAATATIAAATATTVAGGTIPGGLPNTGAPGLPIGVAATLWAAVALALLLLARWLLAAGRAKAE